MESWRGNRKEEDICAGKIKKKNIFIVNQGTISFHSLIYSSLRAEAHFAKNFRLLKLYEKRQE